MLSFGTVDNKKKMCYSIVVNLIYFLEFPAVTLRVEHAIDIRISTKKTIVMFFFYFIPKREERR